MKHSTIFQNKYVERSVSVVVALLIWQIGSMALNNDLLLVSPLGVIQRLGVIIFEGGFWNTIVFSFLRILIGFLGAFIIGCLFAALAGKFHIIRSLLWPFMTAAKSVPVASFIILCLIWLDSSSLSVFVCFLMVVPIIYTNVLKGILETDKKLIEMADIFQMNGFKRVIYIYLPQVKPYIISACSMALGISWKSGVAAEVIGVPAGSIGEKLYDAKIYFNSADLFAWTVVIIIISVVFEKLFLMLLKRAYKAVEAV